MIIVFHGTKEGNHWADAAMVLTASLTMFERQKKVLMLSVANSGSVRNIEMLADSYMKQEHDLNMSIAGDFEFEDTGIDALIRQAGANRLTVEHFNNYVTQLSRSRNYLDIAPETTQRDFETSLVEHPEELRLLLENAEDVYGYVFVLADYRNDELVRMVDNFADKIVVTIPQGQKELLPESLNDSKNRKKINYLVTDYEPESAYGYSVMKKAYGANRFYVLPHNVLFRDAVEDGALVQFAMKNYSVEKTDYNYSLVKALRDLMDHLSGPDKDEKNEKTDDFIHRGTNPVFKENELKELPEENVTIEEVPGKKSFFGRTEGKKVIHIGEPAKEPEDALKEDTQKDDAPEVEDPKEEEEPLKNDSSIEIPDSGNMEASAKDSDEITLDADNEIKEEKPKKPGFFKRLFHKKTSGLSGDQPDDPLEDFVSAPEESAETDTDL